MRQRGRSLKKHRGDQCLNCGIPLEIIDKYCHRCGQINTTKKLSFIDFFNEFLSSIFSYDSRLRYTLLFLFFKPGRISLEFIQGKRVKFANPFRFYFNVSIVFFIIYGLFFNIEDVIESTFGEITTSDDAYMKSNTAKELLIDSLAIHKVNLNNDEIIYYSEDQIDKVGFLYGISYRLKTYYHYYNKTNQLLPEIALDSLNHKNNKYTKYLYLRSKKACEIRNNPSELLKIIFNKLPFIIFFFLPFFTLAIWLLYIRKPFTFMEHLIFVFYTQTMFFILFGISILVNEIIKSESIYGIVIILFLMYLYRSMHVFYNQGKLKTIVKYLLVNILFFILAVIGSVMTLVGFLLVY